MIWFLIEQRDAQTGGWQELDRSGHPAIAAAIAEGIRRVRRGRLRVPWPVTDRSQGIRVRATVPVGAWAECRPSVAQPPAPRPERGPVISWGGRPMVVAAIEPDALHLGQRGRVLLCPLNGRGLARLESLHRIQPLLEAASRRAA